MKRRYGQDRHVRVLDINIIALDANGIDAFCANWERALGFWERKKRL